MPRDPANTGRTPPLRVILLVDSLTQPQWAAASVREMLQSDAVEVVGVVVNGAVRHPETSRVRRSAISRIRNAWGKRNAVLLDRYLRFDARRYPAVGVDPFESKDLNEALAHVPRVDAVPRQTTFSDFFDDEALSAVRALEPDVAVRFGFRILRGPILKVPRFGVWSFHHDDNRILRGGPPGVWEVLLGWPSTGAILQRLSEDLDAGETLARTWTATNMISVNQTRVALYRAAAPLLMHKLRELHRSGARELTPFPGEPAFLPYSKRLFVAPTASELLGGLANVVRRLVTRKMAQFRAREQWQLLLGFDERQVAGNDSPQTAIFRLKPVVPPSDRFWADPFPVAHDERNLVFFEELIFGEGVGRISVLEVTPDGRVSPPRVVLKRPYHLSYPFVFEHDGWWYMMPEMAAHGVQEVFRAVQFPDVWELHSSLRFGQLVVDPTLHFDGVRWWLFVGTAPTPHSACDELSLFYSASPLGPWEPHVANPVVSDARSARPAGRIFRTGDDLIRPAQDCTPTYGTSIVFKRIVRLDLEGYIEEAIGRIDPDWNPTVVGTHTINATGTLTVMDARVLRRQ